MKRFFIIGILILLLQPLMGQDEPSKWAINGYLKQMQTYLLFNDSYFDLQQSKMVDTFLLDNLFHNRVNIRYYASDKLTLRADIRTRIFYGDLVRQAPDYGALIDNVNNDYLDLSLVLIDGSSLVLHTMLDRLYMEYVSGSWEIRLGRQRINWGINTVWNPNDVFNAFAFTFALDYQFTNSLYLNGGYLYNSQGQPGANIVQLFDFDLSAKNLYPYRHAIFTAVQFPFTPLFNGGLTGIYSPGPSNALFLNPNLVYSLKTNWDIDLTGQIAFYNEGGYTSPLQALFLRTKWSF
jgi:hypothetical protein